ncbi:hypothetical protein [Nitrospira sp. KM1]|uniref:hypothetical protein n=1 Tax=Nitrospira sp. KM1 TaxID=1936990 RepID=UPI00156427AF|nr:hypothetical protein [Nitrospira sp. KM1]
MNRTLLWLTFVWLTWPGVLAASEESSPIPGFNQRLNDFLGSEGGVQVYKDADGNVGTVIDPPGGVRQGIVQPPPSPSMNLGPPLQLNAPKFPVPQPVTPTQPPAPDFPQKAR